VIFSLFGKKDGRGLDRKRGTAPATAPARPDPSTGNGLAGGRSPDPREIARLTAAKIDEIESEMNAANGSAVAAPLRLASAQAGLAGTVYVPSGAASAQRAAQAAQAAVAPPLPAASTRPAHAAAAGSPAAAVRPVGRPGADASTSIILGNAAAGGDGLSMEIGGSSLPPAFEEAAVLYSNGQAVAAATILWQAIQDDQLGAHARQAWSMLFDLYQATGSKADYESLAIDFSARFESSPPTWDDTFAPPAPDARAAAPGALSAVAMPAALDAQAVRQLEQVQRFAQRNRGVALDVSAVRTVDAIGADLLLRVITAFAKAQRELVMQGVDTLSAVIATSIEAGRRDPSEACWLLQLELLRVLGRQQEFEDLSIDYCVTYEVSPPPWEPMPASVRTGAPTARAGDVAGPGEGAAFGADGDAFALRGDLEGRALQALAALRAYAADRAEAIIDCRQLRRIDFVAAGELLNEVVALRTGGKYLVFRDLSHPVAALLAVMGIPDLAEIRLRRH
jgi:anti-anti-sigma regulatory factor